jgi:hypothetical protein
MTSVTITVETMYFQMSYDAMKDMQRLLLSSEVSLGGSDIDRHHYQTNLAPWQRGRMLNSALFIEELYHLPGKWSIPRTARQVAWQVLEIEQAYADDLIAASFAGVPWKHKVEAVCMRCGQIGTWRTILQPAEALPPEIGWRLDRPENTIPLCNRCAEASEVVERPEILMDLAWGLWAARFEALHRWYLAYQHHWLPDRWSKHEYPLWPYEYGGDTWAEGSGSFIFSDPQPPHEKIKRKREHYAALNHAMGVYRMRANRHFLPSQYFSILQLNQVEPLPNLGPGEYYCDRSCVYRGARPCNRCLRDIHTTD